MILKWILSNVYSISSMEYFPLMSKGLSSFSTICAITRGKTWSSKTFLIISVKAKFINYSQASCCCLLSSSLICSFYSFVNSPFKLGMFGDFSSSSSDVPLSSSSYRRAEGELLLSAGFYESRWLFSSRKILYPVKLNCRVDIILTVLVQ